MSCSKCQSTRCGCGDTPKSISTSFSNCPDPCESKETCTEVFDMHCICYEGEDIVEYDVKKGDRLDEVMQKILLALSNSSCAGFGDDTTCQSPINLNVSNITTNSFQIEWDATPLATSYNVEYKDASLTTWTINPSVTAPTTSDTIIGLLPGRIYDVRINAICPSTTCYSLTIRITTAE